MPQLNYRDNRGNAIHFEEWRTELEKSENAPKQTIITKDGYEIKINLMYIGTAGSLYKVFVAVSEDLPAYFGYSESYQGATSATNDYNRLVNSINADQDIFSKTKVSPLGNVALFFDARYGMYVVNLLASPEAWTYLTRNEAEYKFNELLEA